MRKAGGIIGLIAGIFGTIAALVTLLVGGTGAAFHANQANLIVGLGFGGLIAAFLTIIFAAVAIGAKTRIPGILLIVTSIAGAIGGGTLVAVFMVLALIGGILASLGGATSREIPFGTSPIR
jgi:hypothetical protein